MLYGKSVWSWGEDVIKWVCQVPLEVKNLPTNAGVTRDSGLTPGLGRSSGVGNGIPL